MPYIGTTPTKVVSRQSANVYRYTATAGQTAFTGADLDNNVLACNPADMIVHMNGLRLESTDYTATSTTVTLTTAATAGDEVTVTSFVTFEVADMYTKTAADTRYVNATGDTMSGPLVVQKSDTSVYNAVQMDNTYTTGISAGAAITWQQGGNVKSSIEANTYGSDYMSIKVSNNVERMRIDSAGRVTMPYQPAFMARKQSFTQTPWSATASWTSISTGNHAGFNASTGVFTAPVTGLYLFYLAVRSDDNVSNNGVAGLQFWKNGSQWEGTDMWSGNAQSYSNAYRPSIAATVNMYLSANDYAQVGITGVISNAYFGGHLIG